MPIKIPDNLPGRAVLQQERVSLITEGDALRQDVRPLQIAILNLMPDKIKTETQLLRALGNTPLQIEITLLHPATHTSKNTTADHLSAFYQTHGDVKHRRFDALIVTGAPVEHLPFEDVNYWAELAVILDWASTHVHSTFFICWGAQAALYHHHGVPKYALPAKLSGIYPHNVTRPFHALVNGFDDSFNVPVSRHTEIRHDNIVKIPTLEIMAESDHAGICLIHEPAARRVYMFNHLEYDAETLRREFERDHKAGMNPALPYNYFPSDNPMLEPTMNWRAHRHLLFSNWINMVYQTTPFAWVLKT